MTIVAEILRSKPDGAVHAIAPTATVFEALRLMADKCIGALLVREGDAIVGIITERDYARKIALVGRTSGETQVHRVDETLGLFGSLEDDEPADEDFELQLAEAPHLEVALAADHPGMSPVQRRRVLRDANAVLVRAIAGATGMTHAQVNSELNRMSGVARVAEADANALERRRAKGAKWLARIGVGSGTGGR